MRSAVTLCLAAEAARGPFVFHGGLADGVHRAAELGFDAVEVFPGAAADVPEAEVSRLLAAHGVRLAAVGTGAGWVRHRWHVCHADAAIRAAAREFIVAIVDAAGGCGAPAIVGSMQGAWDADVPRHTALDMLADALHELGARAARHGQVLLYEPLNRYETNLLNRQADAAEFLRDRGIAGVKLLCDLFHMNLEEADMAAALAGCGELVGHVHWADSNRRAMGLGHTDPEPIVSALQSIGYRGYLSAEVFPLPTPDEAARATIESLRTCTTG